MPKQKTNKAAAKRFFKVTKTGKVKHKSMNCNHILNKKTTKRIRHMRKGGILQNKAEAATIRTLIPYK